MEAQPEANKAMIAAYREADKVNLPLFKQKLTEIQYSDADLKKFRGDRRQAGLGQMGGRQPGQVRRQGRARRPAQGAQRGNAKTRRR